MFLYNITVNIDQDIEKDWLQWMQEVHIPEILSTGLFKENKLFRLLHEPHNEGSTYSVQFFTISLENLDKYLKEYAPAITIKHNDRYRNKHVVFQTVMEFIG